MRDAAKNLPLTTRRCLCLSFLQKKSGWENDKMEVKLKENMFIVKVGKKGI
jgi:hypothetical protein